MDSLRLASIEDHPFVIYRVEKGDTYYSISKEYGFGEEVIEKFNPGSLERIRIGQELRLPLAFKIPFVHRVIAGETLFSLYRIYGVPVEKLMEINDLGSSEISIGQDIIVFLPIAAEDFSDSLQIKKLHTVQKGETLFSISRLYGLKWQDLKNLNNLPSLEINVGQLLLVSIDSGLSYVPKKMTDSIPASRSHEVLEGESLYSISRNFGTQPGILIELNSLETPELRPGQILRLPEPDTLQLESKTAITTRPDEYLKGEKNYEVQMVGSVRKIIERGMCELIEGGEDSFKYLGLHKTLARGTIVQVKNQQNKASVFVRIIGTLPDIDQNISIVLKISPRAYQALSGVNKKFRVEISYFPDLQ
jgi:LysM repeat protein